MKKNSIVFVLILTLGLAACVDNSKPSVHRPENPTHPIRPDSYIDIVAAHNFQITGMYSRNDAQIEEFIKHRLGTDSGANVDDYGKIAELALALVDEKTVESDFENNDLLKYAFMVIDSGLGNLCSSALDANVCFDDWKKNNDKKFSQTKTMLNQNVRPFDISTALISDAVDTDKKIKIYVATTGEITKIDLSDNAYVKMPDSTNFVKNDGDIISQLQYNSAGRSVGLRYSDFGTYQIEKKDIITGTTQPVEKNLFIGGYDTQKIAKADIQLPTDDTEMKYTGRAVAIVEKKDVLERLDIAGTAVLTLDKGGTENLSVAFSDWYDVDVKTDGTINFKNYANNKNKYDMHVADVPENDIFKSDGARMQVNYYAADPSTKIPTETAGTVKFDDANIQLDMAFGATKK
ncbi:MAG: hypothetical protein MJ187_02360 [Alphaproteobacteria bacterium]|nr:hypothetical protein [Alphaproteobacteria bacterium]